MSNKKVSVLEFTKTVKLSSIKLTLMIQSSYVYLFHKLFALFCTYVYILWSVFDYRNNFLKLNIFYKELTYEQIDEESSYQVNNNYSNLTVLHSNYLKSSWANHQLVPIWEAWRMVKFLAIYVDWAFIVKVATLRWGRSHFMTVLEFMSGSHDSGSSSTSRTLRRKTWCHIT